jgi:hypothetical protein
MVDWDRVDELRSKGWDWDRIAEDPKVGFHPDASVTEEGRALRALSHRQRSRRARHETAEKRPSKRQIEEQAERKWTLVRVGYLATPIVGIWTALAFVAPSPVGLILPAFPWLLLALAVAAFVLLFGLWRSAGPRWSKPFRKAVVQGVVLGLVISGTIGLTGYLVFGCPYLPPTLGSSPGGASGWGTASAPAWHDNGVPVFFFYGATWCPYCSASSWALWKALTEFQSGFGGGVNGIPGTSLYYSNPNDVSPSTPEVILANAQVNSPALSFQAAEYYWTQSTGTAGTFPTTGNCYQTAYVTAYAGGSIPFVVLNGQYVHAGASLVNPSDLSSWAASGASTVANSVLTESGAPWTTVGAIQQQAGWICAYVIHSDGFSTVAAFLSSGYGAGLSNPSKYQWTSGMTSLVNNDLSQL